MSSCNFSFSSVQPRWAMLYCFCAPSIYFFCAFYEKSFNFKFRSSILLKLRTFSLSVWFFLLLILFHYRWWSTSVSVCMCEFEGFLRRNKNSFFFFLGCCYCCRCRRRRCLTSHHSFHHSFSRACFHLKFSRDLIYNESIGGFLINVLCGEQTTLKKPILHLWRCQ